jgi:hypothetical protein
MLCNASRSTATMQLLHQSQAHNIAIHVRCTTGTYCRWQVLLDRLANAKVIVVPMSVYRRLGSTAILADVHAQLSRQNKVPFDFLSSR